MDKITGIYDEIVALPFNYTQHNFLYFIRTLGIYKNHWGATKWVNIHSGAAELENDATKDSRSQ